MVLVEELPQEAQQLKVVEGLGGEDDVAGVLALEGLAVAVALLDQI